MARQLNTELAGSLFVLYPQRAGRTGKAMPPAAIGLAMTFGYRIDRWDDRGDSIFEHVAGLSDLIVARAAYRAACRRWPNTKITLRQGARIREKNWRCDEGAGPADDPADGMASR